MLRRALVPDAAGRLLLAAAAEERSDPGQETAAALGLRLAAPTLHVLNLGLELLQPIVGRAQRLVLHDDRLRQEIGGVGLLAHIVRDQGFRLPVARIAGRVAHAIEQALQKLALFG